MNTTPSRRDFIQYLTAAGAGALISSGCSTARAGGGSAGSKVSATSAAPAGRPNRDTRLRVLSIGVVGTIGEADRHTIASHPAVDIVGLCDVDSAAMEKAAKD